MAACSWCHSKGGRFVPMKGRIQSTGSHKMHSTQEEEEDDGEQ